MIERPCPSCSSSSIDKTYFFQDPDGYFPEPLRVVQCSTCGLAYLNPLVKEKTLYFPTYYGKRRGLPAVIFEPFNRFWVGRKARHLLSKIPGKRLLDFGGGRGDFAKAMRERGCDVWILEPQPDTLADLRSTFGTHALGSLDELKTSSGILDAVTLWHVLEHLENPRGVLTDLHRLTGDKGILFLAVPNWSSLERRVLGDRWFHLDVPRHQLHFTTESLERLLRTTGWHVQEVRYASWAYNVFGLFQSLMNLGPGPRNLFYRLCKRGTSFTARDFRFWIGLVWTLVAMGPLMILAWVGAVFLTLARTPGTLEVVAVKKPWS